MKTVPLHGPKAAGRVARVDDQDYELVIQYRWNVWELVRPRCTYIYAITPGRKNGRQYGVIYMHKLITGYARTDHIDHDGLNNQRSNLRPATVAQNSANSGPDAGFSSVFKGVQRVKGGRSWVARIRIDGQLGYLGTFADEEAAARAYDAAAVAAWGDYAYVNFP
jgi:AP2 domain